MPLLSTFAKRWTFHGGLHLADHKAESTNAPVTRAALPEQLILPLQQHIGTPARPQVAVGERVYKGQRLATAEGSLSASLHAPSSGIVTAIEPRPWPHPSGLHGRCLVLETDGLDQWGEPLPPLVDYHNCDPARLRQRVQEAGIVGLGGAAFPTAIKLSPPPDQPIELLILNGAECEPYITCDDLLMRQRARQIVTGLLIMRRAVAAQSAVIAVEDNKPAACQALRQALVDAGDAAAGVSLRQVPTLYPTGGEKQLIRVLTGREVPSHGLPLDLGIVCHNVGTAAAVYDAVIEGRPLLSRYITVTGQGVRRPQVLEVLIGTPVCDLIEHCGGYTEPMERLIMGGPMMGFALSNDRVPVVKGSNCILAASAAELAPPAPPLPCLRCGACMDVCPVKLLPQQLYWYARAENFDKLPAYHLADCIECGCCAAVCPSQIPLVQYYRFAKGEISARQQTRQQADTARQRHEARLQRLERDKQEREAKLRQQKAALQVNAAGGDQEAARQAAVAAAVARARAKQASAAPPVRPPVATAATLSTAKATVAPEAATAHRAAETSD